MMRMNPMLGLARFAHELPDQRREELADSLHAFRQASRPAFGELRSMQKTLREEIRRDPLDPVALRRALDALQSQMQANQSASAEAFVQLMQSLTPAERAALDLSMHPGRHGRHGRPRHPPGERDMEGPPPEDTGLSVPVPPAPTGG